MASQFVRKITDTTISEPIKETTTSGDIIITKDNKVLINLNGTLKDLTAGKDAEMPVIGGRNLLLDTADWSGGSSRWQKRGTVTDNPETYRGMLVATASSAWKSPVYMIQNAGLLQVGKTYTFSTYVRNTSDTETELAGYYDDVIVTPNAVSTSLPAHTDWTRLSRTFKVIKDPTTSTQGIRWESRKDVTNGQIQFAGYKLEEGNIPTDWTPAPEDIQSDIVTANKAIKKNSDDIKTANTNIKKNTDDIKTANTNIKKNTDDITQLKADVAALKPAE